MLCAGEITHFLSCSQNFVRSITLIPLHIFPIMFGRNEEDQQACPVQERQLSLSSLCSYLPRSETLVQAITPILFEII